MWTFFCESFLPLIYFHSVFFLSPPAQIYQTNTVTNWEHGLYIVTFCLHMFISLNIDLNENLNSIFFLIVDN